jgi:hypothetical protein
LHFLVDVYASVVVLVVLHVCSVLFYGPHRPNEEQVLNEFILYYLRYICVTHIVYTIFAKEGPPPFFFTLIHPCMVMSDIFMQYFIGSVGGLFELEMEMECFLGCGFHLNLAPILS